MIIRDLIAMLQKHPDQDEQVCAILWYREDIEGYELTTKEIDDVLSLAEVDHDACIGVNWDVINHHISEVLDARPKVGEQMEFDFGEEIT